MNMMLLTGLSVALVLSITTTNNFYVNKVTKTSINSFDKEISHNIKKDDIYNKFKETIK